MLRLAYNCLKLDAYRDSVLLEYSEHNRKREEGETHARVEVLTSVRRYIV